MEAFMGSYKEKEEQREENQDDDHEENLKTRISSHPLYGLLVETHLDCLKEAYCLALRKLKEAMEEPHRKSMTFITSMHHQLKELTATRSHLDLPESPTSFHHRRPTSGQS
ncbi:PREDICTED: uncharacterized protein LOC101314859 [Fragaria vesca subsp. vesca]